MALYSSSWSRRKRQSYFAKVVEILISREINFKLLNIFLINLHSFQHECIAAIPKLRFLNSTLLKPTFFNELENSF